MNRLLTINFLALMLAASALAAGVSDKEKNAAVVYHYLESRYLIQGYNLELGDPHFLATFTLGNQTRLLYGNDGSLYKRTMPSGEQIFYDQGFPVKRLGKKDELIQETQLTWDEQHHLQQALTRGAQQRTLRFYSQGYLTLEMDYGPPHLLFRRGFSRSADKKSISYFETDSLTGLTSYFLVPEDKGLQIQQWRVTGGLYRLWDRPYHLFMDLVREEIKRQYGDFQRQRRDSFNRTRGEIIVAQVDQNLAYGLGRFLKDRDRGAITFDPQGNYIECHQLIVPLPKVDLKELPHKPPVKVIVKHNQLFYWNKDIKDWQVYPYNPNQEKIIPLNPEQALVEPKEIKMQWQVVPHQQEQLVLSCRLLLTPEIKQRLNARLHEAAFYEPDQDDCRQLVSELNAGREEAARARQVHALAGSRPWRKEDIDLIEPLQVMLSARIKQALLVRPEMKIRDDRHLTQAQAMLASIEPMRVLNRQSLERQKRKIRIATLGTLTRIIYKDLEIQLPKMKKNKLFYYYNRVRKDKGFLQVWEEDQELAEKGFWRAYVLRPDRDVLIQRRHKMLIRVDQGRFLWQATGQRVTERLSGTVILANPNAPATNQPEKNHDQLWTTPPQVFPHQRALSLQAWLPMLLYKNRKKAITVTEPNDARVTSTTTYNWLGKIKDVVVKKELKDHNWQIERYDHDQQLQELQNSLGQHYHLFYRQPQLVELVQQEGNQENHFLVSQRQLQRMIFPKGRMEVTRGPGQTLQADYQDRAGRQLVRLRFDKHGQIKKIKLAQKTEVIYTMHDLDVTLNIQNDHGQVALAKFNRAGEMVLQEGEKGLINFVFTNYPFFNPQHLEKIYRQIVLN